ncbi:hypothetical protein NDU88_003924 [Pleurodeles waltl]|uniref:L1 transposable element RRM domain-containing protein n=1 Tax=Pleurodeles waltl TaxID=8319 RepID=A0AAV7NKU3_PLEWA|nr:hypothetical protein NDU88_003924 [Pleurodeles waltl]
MERVLDVIRAKNEDLEAQSRQNNLRLIGLPESTDIGRMEDFVEEMLSDLFPGQLSRLLVVERAHRSLGPQPPPGAPPRPVIIRLLNYQDRDTILQLARERRPVIYKNTELNFFPDYTPGVHAAHRAFLLVKRSRAQTAARFSLIYLGKLKVQHGGSLQFFTDPKLAARYAKSLPRKSEAVQVAESAAERESLSDHD